MENADKSTQDEILDQLVIEVNELKKQEVKVTDHAADFEALQELIKEHLPHYRNIAETLNEAINKYNLSYPSAQIQAHLKELTTRLEAVPEAIAVKHEHKFDMRSKGWLISGMILLIATAISTGLTGYLINLNGKYKATEVKYRLAKQVAPRVTMWIDSVYLADPKSIKERLEQLERGDTVSVADQQTKKKLPVKGRRKRKRT